MADLELNLLGGVEGTLADGRPLELPTRKSWALLAYLALQPGRPVGRDHLATLLWGDRFDEQARRSLRQTVYEVRKALGNGTNGLLTAEREAVTLRGDGLSVDVTRFEDLVARGDTESLAEADTLYRGPLLEGLEANAPDFEVWLAAERSRLREIACDALGRLATQRLDQGAHAAAIEAARRLIRLDPLREPAHRLLMRALAADGRRSEALKHYRDLEDLLQAELAVAPDAETLRLRDTLADYGEARQQALESPHPAVESDIGMAGAQATATRRGRKLSTWTIAAAAIVAGVIASAAIWQFYPRAPGRLAEVASEANMAFPLPDKPSIAVLPFKNFSGEKQDQFIAKGLTEDIITALSNVPELFVISRTSSFAYEDKPVTSSEVAEQLGVRYIVEGSIQRSSDQIRVNAQLIDAVAGHHLWAENFDGKTEHLFALQDDIVRRITIELQVKLTFGDIARVAGRGTTNLDAWLLRVQAAAEVYKFTRESTARARELLEAAHQLDPDWARPLAGIAWSYWWEARKGWTDDREEWIRKGVELAEKAIEMDPNEPLGYMQLGNLMQIQGDHDRAIALREKAVELAPNDMAANWGLGFVLVRAGQTERGVELLKRAERLAPRHPASLDWNLSHAQLFAGHYEDAVETAKRASARVPDHILPHIQLTAAYSALGRMGEAQARSAEVLRIDPGYTVSAWRIVHEDYKDRAKTEMLAGFLVAAGLPE